MSAIYEIPTDDPERPHRIVATATFIAAHYPGAVLVVVPEVPQPRPITVLAFRCRFTDAEKLTIYTAAEASPAVRIWLDDLAIAQGQSIDLDDPRISYAVHAMEYGGIIGAGRAAEILA